MKWEELPRKLEFSGKSVRWNLKQLAGKLLWLVRHQKIIEMKDLDLYNKLLNQGTIGNWVDIFYRIKDNFLNDWSKIDDVLY